MVSAQSEDVWKIKRFWKAPSELQCPFCSMVRILITILLRRVTLSSDAVPFSSATICCTLFTYLPEAWTERPGDISECYFTGGRMFWTVTWFEWRWCGQQDVAESLLLFAHSHDITSNACTLPKHTIIWYLYSVLEDNLNALHRYSNYGQLFCVYVIHILHIELYYTECFRRNNKYFRRWKYGLFRVNEFIQTRVQFSTGVNIQLFEVGAYRSDFCL